MLSPESQNPSTQTRRIWLDSPVSAHMTKCCIAGPETASLYQIEVLNYYLLIFHAHGPHLTNECIDHGSGAAEQHELVKDSPAHSRVDIGGRDMSLGRGVVKFVVVSSVFQGGKTMKLAQDNLVADGRMEGRILSGSANIKE